MSGSGYPWAKGQVLTAAALDAAIAAASQSAVDGTARAEAAAAQDTANTALTNAAAASASAAAATTLAGTKVATAGGNAGATVATATGASTSRAVSDYFGDVINVKDFGAKGDGITNDSPAFQAAINFATTLKCMVYVPPTSAGYLINTPLNMSNRDGVRLVGAGCNSPATFGLAIVPPRAGSVLIANTGASGCVIDMTGSNNMLLRGLSIDATYATNPSRFGVILGTSTGTQIGNPGGSQCHFDDVSVILQNANSSIPIYGNNLNLSDFNRVSTLGVFGFVLVANNTLNVTPPYGVFGPIIDCDGNSGRQCTFMSWGGGSPVIFEQVNEGEFQFYVLTLNSGPTYTGQPYAMQVKDCVNLRIFVEADYIPSLLLLSGTIDRLDIAGSHFPNVTPLPANIAVLGDFVGLISLSNSSIRVKPYPVVPVTPGNFLYTTVGGTASTVTLMNNVRLLFDNRISSNCAFLNTAPGVTGVPFLNLIFEGDTDAATMSFGIGGVAAAPGNLRYSVNGKALGAG